MAELKITQEMIDAGSAVCEEFAQVMSFAELAAAVYSAMWSARPDFRSSKCLKMNTRQYWLNMFKREEELRPIAPTVSNQDSSTEGLLQNQGKALGSLHPKPFAPGPKNSSGAQPDLG